MINIKMVFKKNFYENIINVFEKKKVYNRKNGNWFVKLLEFIWITKMLIVLFMINYKDILST